MIAEADTNLNALTEGRKGARVFQGRSLGLLAMLTVIGTRAPDHGDEYACTRPTRLRLRNGACLIGPHVKEDLLTGM